MIEKCLEFKALEESINILKSNLEKKKAEIKDFE